jgi:hypothetical protein
MAKKKVILPIDTDGYAVNPRTGTVHTRYAGEHATDAVKVRTLEGVYNVLGNTDPKPCLTCYPEESGADSER